MLIALNKYMDLSFFVTKNPFSGDLNIIKDVLSIKYCLKNLILTQFGERPFDAKLGTSIYSRLFSTKEEDVILINEIHQTIYNHDSRIDDVAVRINRENKTIVIDIEFKLKNSELVNTLQLII